MRAKLLRLAALAGIWGVGLRLAPTVPDALHYPLMHEPAQLCETLTCMKDLGIAVFDLELIRLNADLRASDHLTALEVGQRLGAQVVNVIGDDSDPTRLAASCAALCDAAAPFGLICDIEPMPRSAVPDVASAHRVLPQVQRRNIGVLIDALHFGRSTSTLADVQALPREWLHFDQVCDGTLSGLGREGLIHDALCARLLPGEGDIDLQGLFACMPDDVPINIEVPNDVRPSAMGPEAWARAAVAAARPVLEAGG